MILLAHNNETVIGVDPPKKDRLPGRGKSGRPPKENKVEFTTFYIPVTLKSKLDKLKIRSNEKNYKVIERLIKHRTWDVVSGGVIHFGNKTNIEVDLNDRVH